jgi:hypothetical protein
LLVWAIVDRLNNNPDMGIFEKKLNEKNQNFLFFLQMLIIEDKSQLELKSKILSKARHTRVIFWLIMLLLFGILYVIFYSMLHFENDLYFKISLPMILIIVFIGHRFCSTNKLISSLFLIVIPLAVLLLLKKILSIPVIIIIILFKIFHIISIVSLFILSYYGIEALIFISSFHIFSYERENNCLKFLKKLINPIQNLCIERVLKDAIIHLEGKKNILKPIKNKGFYFFILQSTFLLHYSIIS